MPQLALRARDLLDRMNTERLSLGIDNPSTEHGHAALEGSG